MVAKHKLASSENSLVGRQYAPAHLRVLFHLGPLGLVQHAGLVEYFFVRMPNLPDVVHQYRTCGCCFDLHISFIPNSAARAAPNSPTRLECIISLLLFSNSALRITSTVLFACMLALLIYLCCRYIWFTASATTSCILSATACLVA